MRRATVLCLSLILAGCGQSGAVSPAASLNSQAPTPSAAAPSKEAPTPEASTVAVVNGRIAFRRFLGADRTTGDIFTINPDGTGLNQVTNSQANVVSTEPSWSPDGQWIVYMVAPSGDVDEGRLARIRPDGTDATDLAQTCTGMCLGDGFPAYAPSGRLIAFERVQGEEFHLRAIFVMNADGTNARQITQPGAGPDKPNRYEDFAPTFAPTDALLAFERSDAETGLHAVFTVAMDGTGEFQVTPWDLDASQPDFSPDGEWILFRSNETSGDEGNVWLVHPDGTDAHAVTDSAAGEEKWLSGSFSPDGLHIVNASAHILNGRQQDADVYVMRLDGSDVHNVTDTPDSWESSPEWGPAS